MMERELYSIAESIESKNKNLYKQETKEEYLIRIRKELFDPKIMIENKLNKKVNHVCWPYGGWNETTVKLAKECGYLTRQ